MKIINIGILAHVDAGKTTLTESLLYVSGAIAQQGSVDKGTTRTDTMALERQRGITIQTAVTSFEWNDYKINIVDTPGHMDFLAEVYRSLAVLDGAILVISAKDGVQAQTRILFHALQEMNIPTIIFINKIDQNGIDLQRVYQDIREKLTDDMIVMQEISISPDISIKAISDAEKWDIVIAENDELLERYIAGDFLDPHELECEMRRRTRRCSLYPVYHGSAKGNIGTENLIKMITETFFTETENRPSELCGYVFKVEHTEQKKRLVYLRLYQGTLRLRDTLLLSKKKKVKITEMSIPANGEMIPADYACPGEIVVLTNDILELNSVLGNENLLPRKEQLDNPIPLLRTMVTPQKTEQNNPLIRKVRKGECNFMFAKNSKAYSVYLLFRFVCSLAVSMSTVLSIVYHLEVVQLDAFQLVLVGTVLETSCFLFEIPTGVVADLYSRRRSVLIGMFLYGLGFLMEGALPWFAPVLLAQVVWGCGDTFITGALEAWIASEEEDKPIDKVFLRGSQMGQIGGVLGVVLGTLLGNINLQMPVILGGSLCLLLGLVLVRIMPETNFSPAIEERQGLLKDFVCLFKLNLGFVKGAPVLLALLAITLCGGLASEGFDRLSTAHFLDDTVIPVIGPLNSVTWFGVISLIGSGLGILASQLLIARMEKKGTVSRTSVVMSTSAGYILCLVLFAVGRSFWFMLLVFLLAGLMRTIKEPVLAAWMNDHVDEKMRATVFSTSGQLDSFGQIIGGPIVGLVAQQVSIPWGLVCTAFLLLPALFLVPVAGKKRD